MNVSATSQNAMVYLFSAEMEYFISYSVFHSSLLERIVNKLPYFFAVLCIVVPSVNAEAESRAVDLSYRAEVTEITDAAERIALWLPLPASHENQTVSNLDITGSHPYEVLMDEKYKNHFVYIEFEREAAMDAARESKPWLQINATVTRTAYNQIASTFTMHNPRGDLARYLAPDSLVPIDGPIAEEARKTVGKETLPINQAKLLYTNIVKTVKYDKSGEGWGRGDALFACSVRAGNCSEFHSLFIGEARSLNIPARFIMGFPLPIADTSGTIAGYHCWAEFYVPTKGWVPIDASEAHKHPEKREQFFGGLDEHRVEFTVGRDILLPKSVAGTVNYSIYPQLEVNGVASTQVSHTITFQNSNH